MKRFLSMVIIFILVVIGLSNNKISLINVLNDYRVDYDLHSSVGENLVVKIANTDYKNFIDLLDLEVVNSKEISDRLVIEGYTNKLNNYININNQKVNIQMSITGDEIIVGSPLIYDSF